jgi:hypothetical protein
VATSFVLKKNGVEILNEVYYPDNTNRFKVELKEIIDSTLYISIPTNNMYQQLNAYSTFTIFIDNILSHTFIAVKSGMEGILPYASVFFKGNFLSWQPQLLKVKYQDPQWLTYYACVDCRIRVKYYYTVNNATATQETTLYTMNTGRCYTLNMKYSHLRGYMNPPTLKPTHIEVWAETLAGVKLSYVQRYQLTDAYDRFDDLFMFENSLGGMDVIRFNGWMENRDEHTVSTAVFNQLTKEYELEYNRVFNKNSGYIPTEAYRKWALEFFTTINRYHIADGLNKRIVVSKYDTKNTKGELNDFSFDFSYSEEDRYEQYSRMTTLPAVETDEVAVVPEWVASPVVITHGNLAALYSDSLITYHQI